ncbi:GNAT family N-acetyltransferase [Ornithinibacillus gellani]|uniref:GNAT family N-acetyltransferase n=1 Tax=Ornithinibacillus gellani TaxID=2293253 RepID=UPI000F48B0C6|nr:GNAT family N-acetyltransferase [Ornithinibacillus gellani]TQS76177.1 GNAT family N-acetyltransferase [Ornithinibacillus gellani]
MEAIKRLNIETDYQAIFQLSEFAFQYELAESEVAAKIEDAKRHTIWGWMDGEKIAAKLHLLPLSVYIQGRKFSMGGVASVATWPEYRRQGMAKHLMKHAIHYMRDHGQVVSFLAPFSYAFYRQYGWEHAFNLKHYTIPIEVLRKNWDTTGYVRRIKDYDPVLDDVYTSYAKRFAGAMARDVQWWKQRVLRKEYYIAVAYTADGTANGYVLYQVKDNKVTVSELAFCSLDGQKQLLQFIANHDSMAKEVSMVVPENDPLPLLVDNPRFQQEIRPYFMARIVDVLAFLKQYPFTAGTEAIFLSVIDDFVDENSGLYQLKPGQNGVDVQRLDTQEKPASVIEVSIQQLTTIMLGFTRPLELLSLEKMKGDPLAVQHLETWIPAQQTYTSDYF